MFMYKIVVYAPVTHANLIRKVLAENGAGKMGEYEECSFSCKGIGRFKPSKNAKPFVGEAGIIEEVEEERIETICDKAKIKEVIAAVRFAHPYEETAIDIFEMVDV